MGQQKQNNVRIAAFGLLMGAWLTFAMFTGGWLTFFAATNIAGSDGVPSIFHMTLCIVGPAFVIDGGIRLAKYLTAKES